MKIINSPNNKQLITKLKAEVLKDTAAALERAAFYPETVTVHSSLSELLPVCLKPTVIFTAKAAAKMKSLVAKCSTEIGWHGIVERQENNTYVIKDIIVYPQIASAAHVVANEDEYPVWLYDFPNEIFDNIRMQGHSHVNFGVSPSGVDRNYYEDLTAQVKDYYIFIIVNKQNKVWIEIQDITNGIIFDTADITIANYEDPIVQWTDEILNTQLQKPKPVVVTTTTKKQSPDLKESPDDGYGFGYTQAELAYIRNMKGLRV